MSIYTQRSPLQSLPPSATFNSLPSSCPSMGERRFCMTPEKYEKCTRPGMVAKTGTTLSGITAKTGEAISTSLEFLQSLKVFGPVNFIMNSILLVLIYLEYNSLNDINKKTSCPNYEKMLFKLNLMNTIVSMNMALSLLATIIQYDNSSKISAMVFKVLSFIIAIFNIAVIILSVLFHLDENAVDCSSSTWTWLLWVVAGILLVYQIYIIVMGFTSKGNLKDVKAMRVDKRMTQGFSTPGVAPRTGIEMNTIPSNIWDRRLFE